MWLRNGSLRLEKTNLLNDIYYSKDYLALYLKEGESIFDFKYVEEDSFFYNLSIKRPINVIGNLAISDGFFDLESVYGYGGILTNTTDKKFIDRAMTQYIEKCQSENIIAEFFRFHPFNFFSESFPDYFDMHVYDRDIVWIDLSVSSDDRWKDYSTTTRNILRKCKKSLSFNRAYDVKDFLRLYVKTMDRHNASDFYYFTDEYYKNLLEIDGVELYEVKMGESILGSALFIFSEEYVYYHLSANDADAKSFNANYHMLESAFALAKERGKRFFILGGGVGSDNNDSLLAFKRKFSKLTRPFYICGKVYNEEAYVKYVSIWEKQTSENKKYFLKYRLEL